MNQLDDYYQELLALAEWAREQNRDDVPNPAHLNTAANELLDENLHTACWQIGQFLDTNYSPDAIQQRLKTVKGSLAQLIAVT